MKIFDKMEQWEKDIPLEFYGTKQNAENAERAKKIMTCAEAVRSSCKNAVCKSRGPDNRCLPDHSTVLSVPNYTNILSREINRQMAMMFELADIVRISRSEVDNSIRFMFTVLKVWEA